jgi:glycosyltransferase involved in cell wall biosynthesis
VRVVTVIPSLGGTGGLERVAAILAAGIAPHVERIVVCYGKPGLREEPLRKAGIELVRIERPRPNPRVLARSVGDLARVLAREHPDVVHAHNPAAGVAAWLARAAARRGDAAIVTSFHGVHFGSAVVTRLAMRSADAAIGVGPTSTRSLGLPPGRAVTVLNAVEDAAVRPAPEVRRELGAGDGELVVNVGRYVDLKNQALLLDALARIAPRRPQLRAVLIGEGPLRSELEARVERLGLNGRVTISGPRPDAVDVIAAADVFALSSDSEALPLTLLEAMTYSRPIVTTAVGSIPDTVADGDSALVVPPGDVDAFAAALERLLEERELAARLGANARATVQRHHSVERMVERTLAVYASAVRRRGRA